MYKDSETNIFFINFTFYVTRYALGRVALYVHPTIRSGRAEATLTHTLWLLPFYVATAAPTTLTVSVTFPSPPSRVLTCCPALDAGSIVTQSPLFSTPLIAVIGTHRCSHLAAKLDGLCWIALDPSIRGNLIG